LIVEKQPSVPFIGHPSNGAFQAIDAGTGPTEARVLIFKQRAEKPVLRSWLQHGHFVGATTTSAKPFTVR
jgi:hypothetical protein